MQDSVAAHNNSVYLFPKSVVARVSAGPNAGRPAIEVAGEPMAAALSDLSGERPMTSNRRRGSYGYVSSGIPPLRTYILMGCIEDDHQNCMFP